MVARASDVTGIARLALYLRSRGTLRTRHVTVLTYHRVVSGNTSPFENRGHHVTLERFDRQVAILKRFFSLIDTRAFDAHVQGAALPRNAAMITFDDGYRDNHDLALPILLRHGAPATFFICTRYVSERRMFWWDRLEYAVSHARPRPVALRYPEPMALDFTTELSRSAAVETCLRIAKEWPGLDLDRFVEEMASACGVRGDADEERRLASELVMDWEHVRALHRAGMDVQSHSRSHRVLTTLSDVEMEADLIAARRDLEAQLDAPVIAVAYPAGRPPARDDTVRRAGYRLGFTSGTGVARLDRALDPLRVPRLSMSHLYGPAFFRGLLAFPSLAYWRIHRPSVADAPTPPPRER